MIKISNDQNFEFNLHHLIYLSTFIFVIFFVLAMADRRVTLIVSQKKSKRIGTKSGFVAELDGYLFYNDNSKDTVTFGWRHYWKCKDCSTRLITTEDDLVISVGSHLCEKSEKEVTFYAFR
jgi:hypothetical protein